MKINDVLNEDLSTAEGNKLSKKEARHIKQVAAKTARQWPAILKQISKDIVDLKPEGSDPNRLLADAVARINDFITKIVGFDVNRAKEQSAEFKSALKEINSTSANAIKQQDFRNLDVANAFVSLLGRAFLLKKGNNTHGPHSGESSKLDTVSKRVLDQLDDVIPDDKKDEARSAILKALSQ